MKIKVMEARKKKFKININNSNQIINKSSNLIKLTYKLKFKNKNNKN